ncbi:MAG: hypothetical protein OMM_09469 [Candidatus Magnetoglobus multicellularis str. Araruama]|uniref:Uncharacterized protein n=1 Tax=Candidatus Magnetoglobus multicellularis str. Araruama TaxID=890399 RepID=A0A1V1P4A9_9BACT|nr:MAG: hypothetical protein OMM_09469 [Candidatus Magnetoglobus multicellularis str. Araruama]
MSNTLSIGETFLLSTPPNDMHLFVVIAPTQNGNYICVNVTTKRNNSDTSCVLQSCDHPFINHDSVINYKRAREINPATIHNLINNGNCYRRTPVSADVLYRIQQGGINSTRLKKKLKKALRKYLNNP